MKLPPKLQAFLVSEQLAGKYQHGIIRLNGKRVCRCGQALGGKAYMEMVDHLDKLGLWVSPPYRWEHVMDWTED